MNTMFDDSLWALVGINKKEGLFFLCVEAYKDYKRALKAKNHIQVTHPHVKYFVIELEREMINEESIQE